MEEPQGGISRMIPALLFTLGEQVGNETVMHIVRERTENVAGFVVAPRGEGKALQANHGIATPIGEPVIPGNHRAYLVTGSMRSHGVPDATGRSNHETGLRPGAALHQGQCVLQYGRCPATAGVARVQPAAPLLVAEHRSPPRTPSTLPGWPYGPD